MFKLVVLSALIAVAAAKPSGLGYSALVAPAVAHTEVFAPVAVGPSAVSSTYRKDIISEPVVTAYAAPVVQQAAVYAAPVIQKTVAVAPSAVSSSYRRDVISEPVVTAYAAPAVVAAPVVQKTVAYAAPVAVAAPAVSSTYRKDVIASAPVVTSYAAPAAFATYAAPAAVATYAAPAAVAAYAAPYAVAPAVSSTYRKDIVGGQVVAAAGPVVEAW